jgi:hypothetical protein
MPTRTLRDAQRATKSLDNAIGGPQAAQAEIIGDIFAALEHRLAAIDDILRTLAQKSGVTADDAVQTLLARRAAEETARVGRAVRRPSGPPVAVEKQIRRILG